MSAGDVARAFHGATKHSPESVRRVRHWLDWENRPNPFKDYPGPPRVPLPRQPPSLNVSALDAIATADVADAVPAPDRDALARILRYGAGVLRRRTFADGSEHHFRTYASAGALYPVEVYVASADLDGLVAGVYHFDPKGLALARLREGDHRAPLARAAADERAVADAPVTLVLTGIPWRTAWKYTDRGYRHLFWDAGMIVANVLALAAAARLRARVVLGFVDAEIEALLGLDGRREFPLCLVALGHGSRVAGHGSRVASAADAPQRVAVATPPLSRREREFPRITEVNDAGRLSDPDAVVRWRRAAETLSPRRGAESRGRLADEAEASNLAGSLGGAPPPDDTLEAVIRRRGSAREFGPAAIPVDVLRDVLERSLVGVRTDLATDPLRLTEIHFVANAVDGLAPGAYAFADGAFALLREGRFRREAGFLCLEQPLAAHAAATHFLMTDLDRALETFGDRAYRVAQLEGGIVAGKMYLAAYAWRFGATGLTFYDDLVTEFFSPHAERESCTLVMALGESVRSLGS